ncbi:MAG: ABC transporter substrate-binding protein, partial [Chloroflexota bacterium]
MRTASAPSASQRLTRRTVLLASAGGGASLSLLAACGQQPATTSQAEQPAPAAKAPANVVFACVFAAGERFDRYLKVFQKLNDERKDVQVEVRPGTGSYQTHREKIILEHVAGTPTDFYDNGWGPWTDMVDKGVILDLTPFTKRDKVNLDATFIPETVNAWSYQDKLYAWPHAVSGDCLAVNKGLFDATGLKYPPVNPEDKTWTMDKFLEYAQKMTRAPDQFGWGGSINSYNVGGVTDGTYFGQLAWDDQKQKAMMNQPRFKQGLQFFLDLRHKWQVQPNTEQAASLIGPSKIDIFSSGRIGMNRPGGTIITQPPTEFPWMLVTIPY